MKRSIFGVRGKLVVLSFAAGLLRVGLAEANPFGTETQTNPQDISAAQTSVDEFSDLFGDSSSQNQSPNGGLSVFNGQSAGDIKSFTSSWKSLQSLVSQHKDLQRQLEDLETHHDFEQSIPGITAKINETEEHLKKLKSDRPWRTLGIWDREKNGISSTAYDTAITKVEADLKLLRDAKSNLDTITGAGARGAQQKLFARRQDLKRRISALEAKMKPAHDKFEEAREIVHSHHGNVKKTVEQYLTHQEQARTRVTTATATNGPSSFSVLNSFSNQLNRLSPTQQQQVQQALQQQQQQQQSMTLQSSAVFGSQTQVGQQPDAHQMSSQTCQIGLGSPLNQGMAATTLQVGQTLVSAADVLALQAQVAALQAQLSGGGTVAPGGPHVATQAAGTGDLVGTLAQLFPIAAQQNNSTYLKPLHKSIILDYISNKNGFPAFSANSHFKGTPLFMYKHPTAQGQCIKVDASGEVLPNGPQFTFDCDKGGVPIFDLATKQWDTSHGQHATHLASVLSAVNAKHASAPASTATSPHIVPIIPIIPIVPIVSSAGMPATADLQAWHDIAKGNPSSTKLPGTWPTAPNAQKSFAQAHLDQFHHSAVQHLVSDSAFTGIAATSYASKPLFQYSIRDGGSDKWFQVDGSGNRSDLPAKHATLPVYDPAKASGNHFDPAAVKTLAASITGITPPPIITATSTNAHQDAAKLKTLLDAATTKGTSSTEHAQLVGEHQTILTLLKTTKEFSDHFKNDSHFSNSKLPLFQYQVRDPLNGSTTWVIVNANGSWKTSPFPTMTAPVFTPGNANTFNKAQLENLSRQLNGELHLSNLAAGLQAKATAGTKDEDNQKLKDLAAMVLTPALDHMHGSGKADSEMNKMKGITDPLQAAAVQTIPVMQVFHNGQCHNVYANGQMNSNPVGCDTQYASWDLANHQWHGGNPTASHSAFVNKMNDLYTKIGLGSHAPNIAGMQHDFDFTGLNDLRNSATHGAHHTSGAEAALKAAHKAMVIDSQFTGMNKISGNAKINLAAVPDDTTMFQYEHGTKWIQVKKNGDFVEGPKDPHLPVWKKDVKGKGFNHLSGVGINNDPDPEFIKKLAKFKTFDDMKNAKSAKGYYSIYKAYLDDENRAAHWSDKTYAGHLADAQHFMFEKIRDNFSGAGLPGNLVPTLHDLEAYASNNPNLPLFSIRIQQSGIGKHWLIVNGKGDIIESNAPNPGTYQLDTVSSPHTANFPTNAQHFAEVIKKGAASGKTGVTLPALPTDQPGLATAAANKDWGMLHRVNNDTTSAIQGDASTHLKTMHESIIHTKFNGTPNGEVAFQYQDPTDLKKWIIVKGDGTFHSDTHFYPGKPVYDVHTSVPHALAAHDLEHFKTQKDVSTLNHYIDHPTHDTTGQNAATTTLEAMHADAATVFNGLTELKNKKISLADIPADTPLFQYQIKSASGADMYVQVRKDGKRVGAPTSLKDDYLPMYDFQAQKVSKPLKLAEYLDRLRDLVPKDAKFSRRDLRDPLGFYDMKGLSTFATFDPANAEHQTHAKALLDEAFTQHGVPYLTAKERRELQTAKSDIPLIRYELNGKHYVDLGYKVVEATAAEVTGTGKYAKAPELDPRTGKWKTLRTPAVADLPDQAAGFNDQLKLLNKKLSDRKANSTLFETTLDPVKVEEARAQRMLSQLSKTLGIQLDKASLAAIKGVEATGSRPALFAYEIKRTTSAGKVDYCVGISPSGKTTEFPGKCATNLGAHSIPVVKPGTAPDTAAILAQLHLVVNRETGKTVPHLEQINVAKLRDQKNFEQLHNFAQSATADAGLKAEANKALDGLHLALLKSTGVYSNRAPAKEVMTYEHGNDVIIVKSDGTHTRIAKASLTVQQQGLQTVDLKKYTLGAPIHPINFGAMTLDANNLRDAHHFSGSAFHKSDAVAALKRFHGEMIDQALKEAPFTSAKTPIDKTFLAKHPDRTLFQYNDPANLASCFQVKANGSHSSSGACKADLPTLNADFKTWTDAGKFSGVVAKLQLHEDPAAYAKSLGDAHDLAGLHDLSTMGHTTPGHTTAAAQALTTAHQDTAEKLLIPAAQAAGIATFNKTALDALKASHPDQLLYQYASKDGTWIGVKANGNFAKLATKHADLPELDHSTPGTPKFTVPAGFGAFLPKPNAAINFNTLPLGSDGLKQAHQHSSDATHGTDAKAALTRLHGDMITAALTDHLSAGGVDQALLNKHPERSLFQYKDPKDLAGTTCFQVMADGKHSASGACKAELPIFDPDHKTWTHDDRFAGVIAKLKFRDDPAAHATALGNAYDWEGLHNLSAMAHKAHLTIANLKDPADQALIAAHNKTAADLVTAAQTQHSISLDLAALQASHPDHPIYQYQLKNGDWIGVHANGASKTLGKTKNDDLPEFNLQTKTFTVPATFKNHLDKAAKQAAPKADYSKLNADILAHLGTQGHSIVLPAKFDERIKQAVAVLASGKPQPKDYLPFALGGYDSTSSTGNKPVCTVLLLDSSRKNFPGKCTDYLGLVSLTAPSKKGELPTIVMSASAQAEAQTTQTRIQDAIQKMETLEQALDTSHGQHTAASKAIQTHFAAENQALIDSHGDASHQFPIATSPSVAKEILYQIALPEDKFLDVLVDGTIRPGQDDASLPLRGEKEFQNMLKTRIGELHNEIHKAAKPSAAAGTTFTFNSTSSLVSDGPKIAEEIRKQPWFQTALGLNDADQIKRIAIRQTTPLFQHVDGTGTCTSFDLAGRMRLGQACRDDVPKFSTADHQITKSQIDAVAQHYKHVIDTLAAENAAAHTPSATVNTAAIQQSQKNLLKNILGDKIHDKVTASGAVHPTTVDQYFAKYHDPNKPTDCFMLSTNGVVHSEACNSANFQDVPMLNVKHGAWETAEDATKFDAIRDKLKSHYK